jgi:hypothetical protein
MGKSKKREMASCISSWLSLASLEPAKPCRWRLLSICRAGFSSLLLLVPAQLRYAWSYIPLERLVGEIEAMLAGRLPPGYT